MIAPDYTRSPFPNSIISSQPVVVLCIALIFPLITITSTNNLELFEARLSKHIISPFYNNVTSIIFFPFILSFLF